MFSGNNEERLTWPVAIKVLSYRAGDIFYIGRSSYREGSGIHNYVTVCAAMTIYIYSLVIDLIYNMLYTALSICSYNLHVSTLVCYYRYR